MFKLFFTLSQTVLPYESGPGKPCKELPEEFEDIDDNQLALCQAIFSQTETRRVHVEQKAHWTFTAIAFLMPVIASIVIFLIRDPALRDEDWHVSLVLLFVSAGFLLWSFMSALRAIAIREHETLFIHTVIKQEDGTFLKYNRHLHAQGLLHCVILNTATNDHISQFVKGAHWLLALAVIFFALGTCILVSQIIGSSATVDILHMPSAPVMGGVFAIYFPLGKRCRLCDRLTDKQRRSAL